MLIPLPLLLCLVGYHLECSFLSNVVAPCCCHILVCNYVQQRTMHAGLTYSVFLPFFPIPETSLSTTFKNDVKTGRKLYG